MKMGCGRIDPLSDTQASIATTRERTFVQVRRTSRFASYLTSSSLVRLLMFEGHPSPETNQTDIAPTLIFIVFHMISET